MFISHLVDKIEQYDKYGEYRMNGLKAFYLAELLFIAYYFSNITTPYFYYFYVPLTAIAAECAGYTLNEKYRFFFYTLLGSTLLIFCYGLMSPYRAFFILFVLISTRIIYHFGLRRDRAMFVATPIILSLGAYSLIYVEADTDVYIALNNALKTLYATLVLFIGLLAFPKSIYLKIWYKAFYRYCRDIERIAQNILDRKSDKIEVISSVLVMERFAHMLSVKTKYYSILRITMLSFHLSMSLSYLLTFREEMDDKELDILIQQMRHLTESVKSKRPVQLKQSDVKRLSFNASLQSLYKIMLSWNTACQTV